MSYTTWFRHCAIIRKVARVYELRGYTHAYPHLGNVTMPEQPAFDMDSGYVQRGLRVLPKSSTRRPWKMSQNYLRDVLGRPFESIKQSMVFGSIGSDGDRHTRVFTGC